MHLLNFTYSSLTLECRVLSKFLGERWEYFCEHLLVLNQIYYIYFSLYIPISFQLKEQSITRHILLSLRAMDVFLL